jgi:hypothetical protein
VTISVTIISAPNWRRYFFCVEMSEKKKMRVNIIKGEMSENDFSLVSSTEGESPSIN